MSAITSFVWSIDREKVVHIFSALLTPVIALLAVYIAWQQHKISKNQFRLALLERRLRVFNAAGELIAAVLRRARAETDDLVKFVAETRERDFLFGSDIAAYLDELYSKAVEVYGPTGVPPEEPRKHTAALMWFSRQLDEAKKKFSKYMAFRD